MILAKIPIFITARGNDEIAIKRNEEALKYAYVFIKEMNLFIQTWIISDNEEMLQYAKKLGFYNTFYNPCKNEDEIAYLDYIGIYNFYLQKKYKPDWFILLALNQLFRNPQLISDCIKNIDDNFDVVASYTDITNRSSFFIDDQNDLAENHPITHVRDRKKMIDAAIYAIKADFAIKCMENKDDPSKIFWLGKIKYFKNNSLYTDICSYDDIKKYEYVGYIINKVKALENSYIT